MAMIYKAEGLTLNIDRQKWQIYCSVFVDNPNQPNNPTPVNAFQSILIDVPNTSDTGIKQACIAFCGAVADATSPAVATDVLGKMINADTGAVIEIG